MQFIDAKKRDLVKRLSNLNVSNVRFDGQTISLNYDGHVLHNRVRALTCEPWVGHWNRQHNIVYYDDDMGRNLRQVQSLAVHETIEKYVCQRYGLNSDAEGHYVAEMVERKYARKLGIDLRDYEWRTEFVHRKEWQANQRRMQKTIRDLKSTLRTMGKSY